MTYMDGMEAIDHSIMDTVLAATADYNYEKYTEQDVLRALNHDAITVEDYKALLSPPPFLTWKILPAGQNRKHGSTLATAFPFSLPFTLPTIVKITVFTAVLIVKIESTGHV